MKLSSRMMVMVGMLAASHAFGAVTCLTNNSGNCSALQPNFSVTTVNANTIQVNNLYGTTNPVVTSIFFDFATPEPAFTAASFTLVGSGAGVNYSAAAGGNLPSGNSAVPAFDTDFTFSPASPPPTNGLNGGEYLRISATGLAGMFTGGTLRIGLHVQSVGTSGQYSESLLITSLGGPDPNSVPEPSTMGMMGVALAGLGFIARRKRS